MGLISAIKSLLGIGGSRDRSRERTGGTDVTVERETDATSERAVKESDASATGTGDAADTDEGAELTFGNEPEAAGDDEAETPEEDATETPTGADVESPGDDAGDTTAEGPPAADETDGETVEDIKGIGPAYAERLADAGVHTVADLADADAADLDAATGIGENRLQGWIDRANAR